MTDALIERMVHRCYQRMIAAQFADSFGLAMHWWQRLHHYARRRQ